MLFPFEWPNYDATSIIQSWPCEWHYQLSQYLFVHRIKIHSHIINTLNVPPLIIFVYFLVRLSCIITTKFLFSFSNLFSFHPIIPFKPLFTFSSYTRVIYWYLTPLCNLDSIYIIYPNSLIILCSIHHSHYFLIMTLGINRKHIHITTSTIENVICMNQESKLG